MWSTVLGAVIEIVRHAPQLISAGQQAVEGAQKVWDAVTAEHPPTPEQQAEYDQALQEAHDALQRS